MKRSELKQIIKEEIEKAYDPIISEEEGSGAKNPEADKMVKRLLIAFAKQYEITEPEAAAIIRASLKRIGH